MMNLEDIRRKLRLIEELLSLRHLDEKDLFKIQKMVFEIQEDLWKIHIEMEKKKA